MVHLKIAPAIKVRCHVTLTTRLFLLLVTICSLTLQVQIFAFDDDCLRCDDFNRQNLKACAKSYSDCGACLPAFIQDTDDPRLCFQIEILESTEEKIAAFNENVYLPCKFNAVVKCQWTKNKEIVDISKSNSLYSWSNSENGINTDDCSVNIEHLSTHDIGDWICSNKANSDVESVKSKPVHVSINSKITVQPDKSYFVAEGESVKINCEFDFPVKCSWKKDGLPVKSRGNYEFTNGKQTTDCSLTIESFNYNRDSGTWQCLRLGDSKTEGAGSRLTVIKRHEKPNYPQNNKKEPSIYLGTEDVTRQTVVHAAGANSLLNVNCKVPSDAYRLFWFLPGQAEHTELIVGRREISVDQKLQNAIEKQLEREKRLELWCLVEYDDGESRSATVIIINNSELGQSQTPIINTAGLNTMLPVLIVVIVVMVIMLFAVAAFVIYWLRKQKNSKSETSPSDKKPAEQKVDCHDQEAPLSNTENTSNSSKCSETNINNVELKPELTEPLEK